MKWRLLIVLLLALLGPAGAEDRLGSAADEAVLSGRGLTETRVTEALLQSLPQTEMDVAFATSKGENRGRYRGVLLWTLLERAGLLEGKERHDELRRTFKVIGRDGYRIVFGIGEVVPDFGNRPILLATTVDGASLPPNDGLRLIVPGDRRGARNVRDVVRIEVQ